MKNGHIKIDKGIPVPTRGRGPKGKYPFPAMKVGDSFFSEVNPLSAAIGWASRHNGETFRTSKDGEGFRCWRIK